MKKNDHDHWHDLIQKQLAGIATPEESTELEQALEDDAKLRTLYLDYANLDMALESSAKAATALQEAQLLADRPAIRKSSWFSLRPLTTAAAGIVIGVLTSSIVWAVSANSSKPQRIPVPLVDPRFEEVVTPLPAVIPRSIGSWNGDPSHVAVSSGEVSAQTKMKGESMVKMQPVDERRFSRLEQIVRVEHLVPAEGGTVDFSADIFCDSAVHPCRAMLVVRAFSLSSDEIEGSARDLQDEVTSTARKAVILSPGMTSWQRGKVRMDLPPDTKTLVFAIVAIDPPKGEPNASQYIDNVRAAILATNPSES